MHGPSVSVFSPLHFPFLSHKYHSNSCNRPASDCPSFAEVVVTTIITLIIRKYKVSIDPVLCPDVVGETKLQRRERVLRSYLHITVTPYGIPLVFTRRT